MTQPTIPGVGRVVHYVSPGSGDGKYPSVCRAADITEVLNPKTDAMDRSEQRVGLMVKNPTGIHFRPLAEGGAVYDSDGAPYTWHWPERV